MRVSDRVEGAPTPLQKDEPEETLSFRITGNWLTRWRLYMLLAGNPKKSDVVRDALSLLFATASTGGTGTPVQIVLRRVDEKGNALPDVELIDFLNLPTLKAWRKGRLDRAGDVDLDQ